MHEACLTLMMTSISHPFIFGMLILCDVLENTYCLWSLHRTISGGMKKANKVVPHSTEDAARNEVVEYHSKKTLTKRSSTVGNLVRDLDETTSKEERQGTALFIAATLLQREMIETFVPIQAICIISILYSLDVKSNSVVSNWNSEEDYYETMVYMGIDLGVELIVFVMTIFALRSITPDISVWRILSGLLRMHVYPMSIYMFTVWYACLFFQSTMTGLDTTFRFSWIGCKGNENSTWVGGFDFEC